MQPPPARRHRRAERNAGLVVLALVVIGAIVAAGLLSSGSGNSGKRQPGSGQPGPSAIHIAAVNVFMVNGRSPDNPDKTPLTFDGNPATYWQTDVYNSPTFGNLYPGIGLSIELGSASDLHQLSVTSPTTGWSASVYVSDSAVQSGQPVSAWGQSVDSKSAIPGNATFSLAGHKGRYVLLWITNLGPANTAKVAELSLS